MGRSGSSQRDDDERELKRDRSVAAWGVQVGHVDVGRNCPLSESQRGIWMTRDGVAARRRARRAHVASARSDFQLALLLELRLKGGKQMESGRLVAWGPPEPEPDPFVARFEKPSVGKSRPCQFRRPPGAARPSV